MGLAFSIFGLVFLFGAVLFLIAFGKATLRVFRSNAQSKGGRGLPFLFFAAFLMMAAPVATLLWLEKMPPAHAFKLFFKEAPPAGVEILHNASGTGVDYATIALALRMPDDDTATELVKSAGLDPSDEPIPQLATSDIPDWWAADKCAGTPLVFRAKHSDDWNKKWVSYCPADHIAYAYASWVE